MYAVRQLLIFGGLIVLMAPLAWPNFKRVAQGSTQLFSKNPRLKKYDTSKIKNYVLWVLGITAFYAVYNSILAPNFTEAYQYTGIELLLATAGLITIILEKKER